MFVLSDPKPGDRPCRHMGDHLIPILLVLWQTLLCAGFAALYWLGIIHDPRNLLFSGLLSHIGAIMVFPVGWAVLVWKTMTGDLNG